MSIKTIIAIIIAVLITIIIMQNNDEVPFTILFTTTYLSKLIVLAGVAILAFIAGVMVGRPKKAKYDISGYHDDIHKDDNPDTLSDEDRDYIS